MSWLQTQKLQASDGTPEDSGFGISLAVDGDLAVVGSYFHASADGAAYLFARSLGVWSEIAHLEPTPGSMGLAGLSVAISGDVVAVGAPYGPGFTAVGCVYIFKSGALQAVLTASDAAPNTAFGFNVALNGNTLAVGAQGAGGYQGAVYIFIDGVEAVKLTKPGGGINDAFGNALLLTDGVLAVGSKDSPTTVTTQIFTGSGASWSLAQTLPDYVPNGGSLNATQMALTKNDGRVSIFTGGGGSWALQQEISHPNGFAASGRVDGTLLALGTPDVTPNERGAAFVYGLAGGSWTLDDDLVMGDPADYARFGERVATAGHQVLVSADGFGKGAVYVFESSAPIPPPYLDSLDPNRDATIVSITTNVTGKILSDVGVIDAASIVIRLDGDLVWSSGAQVSPFICTCTRISDLEYDYSFHGPTLSYSTLYDVRVVATVSGAVDTLDDTYSFTTADPPPYLADLDPDVDATAVLVTTNITGKILSAVGAIDAISITIRLNGDFVWFFGGPAFPFTCTCVRISDLEYDYSFHGPTSLSYSTIYDVRVVATASGAVDVLDDTYSFTTEEEEFECFLVLNRGKNTRPVPGPDYIYWTSERETDINGEEYPSPPPFGIPFSQLTEISGSYRPIPLVSSCRFVLNRGRNIGAGPTYIYWISYGVTDLTGAFYPAPDPFDVPFEQLTNIIGVFSGSVSGMPSYDTFDSASYGTDTFGG